MNKYLRGSALLPFMLVAAIGTARADESDHPLGGWRVTSTDTADYMQDVHYPAVRVNAGGKTTAALISGHIKTHPKGGRVPLLIVNGNALPLPMDEGNDYARPFAFGSGSNNVEVRDDEGKVVRRTQFYEGNTAKIAPGLRVILAWDTNHTDLDLHVVTPSGEHAWYGDRVIPSGGSLDVDVTDGYGPEIFSSLTPEAGTYLVYANYYGGTQENPITEATVTIIQHENTLREKREIIHIPMRKAGELNFVGSFIYQP